MNIYKGVDNRIFFSVRNSDRRAIPTQGLSFVAYMVHNQTEDLLLEKELDVVDASRGEYELFISVEDTDDWKPGTYRLVVTKANLEGDTEFVYADEGYTVIGEVYVHERALPIKRPIIISKASEWLRQDNTPRPEEPHPHDFVSSTYKGIKQVSNTLQEMSVTVNSTSYTGKFIIEGSNRPTADSVSLDWFPIEINGNNFIDYTNFDGTQKIIITEKTRWIRFRLETAVKFFAKSVTIVQAGSGYENGDILTLSGGNVNAQFEVVTAVGGAIETLSIINPGNFSSVPVNPVELDGGSGSGIQVSISWERAENIIDSVTIRY